MLHFDNETLTREEKIKDAIYNTLSEYRFDKLLEKDILFYILKQTVFIFSLRKKNNKNKNIVHDIKFKIFYKYLNIPWDEEKTHLELAAYLIKVLIEKGVDLSKKIKRHENILDFAVLNKLEFKLIRIFLEAGVIPENPSIVFNYLHKKMQRIYPRIDSENFSVCYSLFVSQQTELRNIMPLDHHLRLSDRLYHILIRNSKFASVYLNDNQVNSKLLDQIYNGLPNFPTDLVKLIASYDYRNKVFPEEKPSLSMFRFFSPPAIAKIALIGGMIGGISGAVIGAGIGTVGSYVVNKDQDNRKLYNKK